MATTAWADGHRVLYHWQRFNEERLRATLQSNRIYCSSPGAFNDPWDCKPHFNSEVLADPAESERHANWAVDLCSRKTFMSQQNLEHMRHTLLSDRVRATELLRQISDEMAPEINRRYRVYCLGPTVSNLLMWAHYADSHTGVCLEFDIAKEIWAAAGFMDTLLRCEDETGGGLWEREGNLAGNSRLKQSSWSRSAV